MYEWVCIERVKRIPNKLELDMEIVDSNRQRLKKKINSLCNVPVLKMLRLHKKAINKGQSYFPERGAFNVSKTTVSICTFSEMQGYT